MTTRLVLASVLLSATAYAQAPGEVPSSAPGMVEPTPVAPVVIAPPPHAIDPMARRFAIGLGVGAFGVSPEDGPEGSETEFNIAEIGVRFRATRRLEVFLAFAGGRQVVDGETGDLATDLVTLGARFNFRPEHRWNWFLLAGFGSTLIAHHETPEEVRDDLRRGHVMFGGGVERRFQRFALQAELRAISIAEDDEMTVAVEPGVGGGATTTPASTKLGGGQFTLGGSFYF